MNMLQMLYHWVIPHQSNNHRSKALHLDVLFGYTLLLLVFNFSIQAVHRRMPDILGYATDIRVEQLLGSTNAKRQSEGLSGLALNELLSNAAAAKAADMLSNNYWAHTSPSGKTPWDFINTSGYRYTLAGENLAKNFQTSDGVVDAWMGSPTHKENLLKAGYRDVGFAVVNGVLNGEETTLVVQMFGATKSVVAQVPQVQAEEPVAVREPVTAQEPVAVQEPVKSEAKPLVVQVPAEAQDDNPIPANVEVPAPLIPPAPSYLSVASSPRLNLESVTHVVVFIFVGMLMGILAVDWFVVSHRKVVRLAGHNIAHILFLFSMVIGGLFISRGSLM